MSQTGITTVIPLCVGNTMIAIKCDQYFTAINQSDAQKLHKNGINNYIYKNTRIYNIVKQINRAFNSAVALYRKGKLLFLVSREKPAGSLLSGSGHCMAVLCLFIFPKQSLEIHSCEAGFQWCRRNPVPYRSFLLSILLSIL